MTTFAQKLEPSMTKEFSLGEEVIIRKIAWDYENPNGLAKIDARGTITSIKGISPNHSYKYKYEVTWSGGRFFNNGDKLIKIS